MRSFDGYSLSPEKPPDSQDFAKQRMTSPVPVRSIDHVCGHAVSCSQERVRLRIAFGRIAAAPLRLSETAPSQTPAIHGSSHHGAQKNSPRRARQRANRRSRSHIIWENLYQPLIHDRPSSSGWSEATPARHRFLQEAPVCRVNVREPVRADHFACQSRPTESAPSRDSANRFPQNAHQHVARAAAARSVNETIGNAPPASILD